MRDKLIENAMTRKRKSQRETENEKQSKVKMWEMEESKKENISMRKLDTLWERMREMEASNKKNFSMRKLERRYNNQKEKEKERKKVRMRDNQMENVSNGNKKEN